MIFCRLFIFKFQYFQGQSIILDLQSKNSNEGLSIKQSEEDINEDQEDHPQNVLKDEDKVDQIKKVLSGEDDEDQIKKVLRDEDDEDQIKKVLSDEDDENQIKKVLSGEDDEDQIKKVLRDEDDDQLNKISNPDKGLKTDPQIQEAQNNNIQCPETDQKTSFEDTSEDNKKTNQKAELKKIQIVLEDNELLNQVSTTTITSGIRYLIYVPVMRVPSLVPDTANAYLAFRSAILAGNYLKLLLRLSPLVIYS